MRPLRFLLTLTTCIIAFFFLLYTGPWRASAQNELEGGSRIRAYLNWRTPSSLFPPSAIISLTDDNSTFFLARPAAFGPLLPPNSLSGQLWIGSGFGDDRLGRGGSGAGSEGELGCSDVPGWDHSNNRVVHGSSKVSNEGKASKLEAQEIKIGNKRKRETQELHDDHTDAARWPTEDDGTDDHLHHPLPPSNGLSEAIGIANRPTHADIQSLQESAEIAGKVVLLSRGGCGFLEKVKWVQRRGGIALVVGDDIRGGPLVTMYARGDTSNVTIPSLFTSYTTAHLLSTLVPSGGIMDSIGADEAGRLGLALGDKEVISKLGVQKNVAVAEEPVFTTTTTVVKSTQTSRAQWKEMNSLSETAPADGQETIKENLGWFRWLFGSKGDSGRDSRRPPSSGNIGWVVQEEFEESRDTDYRKSIATSTSNAPVTTTTPGRSSGDGFVIGVQDWRDPDLVAEQKEQLLASSSSSTASIAPQSSRGTIFNGPEGGSITPGSGEYVKAVYKAATVASSKNPASADSSRAVPDDTHEKSYRWFGGMWFSDDENPSPEPPSKKIKTKVFEPVAQQAQAEKSRHDTMNSEEVTRHEGLWVTLTPTSVSSSPFFDTLLVLVVSPLVTLTVVYALLLLRSRIRRHRWRAPKSVVERLPVRTYQTIPSTTTTNSTASSVSSPINATTPLLPSAARSISARSRPRSRTTGEVPVPQNSSIRSDGTVSPSAEQIEEKRTAGLAEWRRRYGGKQHECVVCLEEYVDGVSRVMSLPCGHEFHVECITPWLTTRRRTCPICKGDVVRSLARSTGSSSGSSPHIQYRHDEDGENSDDVQERAATARNDDPASNRPVSREDEAFEDLERGVAAPDRTR